MLHLKLNPWARWARVVVVLALGCGSAGGSAAGETPARQRDPSVAGVSADTGAGAGGDGQSALPAMGGGASGAGASQPSGAADTRVPQMSDGEPKASDGASAVGAAMEGAAGSAAAAGDAAASGEASSGATSRDCGIRSGMRGKTSRSVMVGGAKRTFIAYLPEQADPGTPLPFVYVFHGATQTGQQLYDMTEYAKLADSEGIAVVFPDGQGVSSASSTGSLTPWHVSDGPLVCGAGTLVSNGNASDLDFVDAIRADVEQDQCIDSEHVFATGFSMGGYFSHHIACKRSDFRAAAPHSGGTLADLSSCTTDHMPIIIFHGTADPLIADNCDDPMVVADPGFTASATLWAEKNGCQSTYTTRAVAGTGGANGSCYVYDDCPADGQVEMCAFEGMAHCWAGAPVCPGCIGEGPNYASATRLEWEFFKKYAW